MSVIDCKNVFLDKKHDRLIGESIKTLRLSRGLSVPDLARIVEINAALLVAYEEGREAVPVTVLNNICEYCSISLEEFFKHCKL